MNDQEINACFMDATNDESDKTSKSPSPLSKNIFHSFNNLDTSQPVLERNYNRAIDDPVKYLDFQRLLIDQGNSMMTLKITEYERALAGRDYTIKSLHTDMLNSQNNNHVLTNQYKAIMEKTNLVSDTCINLNTSFTSICERLNRLEDTVKNVKTRQKEIINTVDQTTKMFEEKNLSISDSIDDSIKQVNLEKTKAKQDLEALENKYSLQIVSYKVNSEECTKEINNLRSEINLLLEKINEANIKLNEEKETASSLKNNFEKELKELESQNTLIKNKYESINVEYEEILIENQSLKDELFIMKTSLDENKNELDVQLNIIKEQTELLNNLKIAEELNQTLINEKCALEERNKYLEKINTDLMDNNKSNKVSQIELDAKENKIKDMCKNYDDLLKMKEDKLYDIMERLELLKESENKAQIEVIDLKQEVETHNNTIMNLQKKLNANVILIPKLQSTIDGLNTDLVNTNQKLQDYAKKHAAERSELVKEKNELENQSTVQLNDIKKLKYNYMKYKSKTKKFYTEIIKLRYECSQLKQKNNIHDLGTIDIISDEEADGNDSGEQSVIEFHDRSVSNINTSLQCISNKMNRIPNSSSLKRSASASIKHDGNIKTKKGRTAIDIAAYQENISS